MTAVAPEFVVFREADIRRQSTTANSTCI